jgi:methylmalonyl-CoA mutase N-terminal domain/subunit
MDAPKSKSGINYEESSPVENIPGAGHFPFRSGIHGEMYRTRPWTMRQYAGFGRSAEANERLRQIISAGATGLSIAFDLPTQMGLDPDDEMALAEVGKVGVSISCLDDMRLLLEGIDVENVSTSMTINATAPILLLMYQIVAEQREIDPIKLKGTIQNDILKEFISRGTYIFPIEPSIRLMLETIEYCNQNLPNWNSVSFSGYHMAEAGATSIQEIAFSFANAIACMDEIYRSRIDLEMFTKRLSFFFASKTTILEEICKFRAAREVWAGIVKDRYGIQNPKSMHLRFHTQTAGVQLAAQDPELNIVRVTLQALGAVFGGTQSLHTNSYDEAISLPSEDAARVAIRTQQIILEETDLALAVDPFRGSYLIENMTSQFVTSIRSEIQNILNMGGATAALRVGYQRSRIEENAFHIASDIESGRQKVIGVNCWQSINTRLHERSDNGLKFSDFKERMKRHRSQRDNVILEKHLHDLNEASKFQEPLLPIMKSCIIAGGTVGEICNVLRHNWGTHADKNVF